MSAPGAVPTTSNGPMATDQLHTSACGALGQPTGDDPAAEVGLAHSRSRH
jgi:hypothetical protein